AAETGGGTAGGEGGEGGEGGAAKRWGMQFYEFSLREQTYCWFMEWVWRAGGEVWASDRPAGRDRARATLDTPAALRALQFQVDLLHGDRTAVPPGTPVPELIANVAQGRVGFWVTTANAALTYERTAPGLRFGVGPLPADRRDAHQLQHNALSVFKDSRTPELAYRLLSFRAREDVQARWAAEGAWLPVRPSLWTRPPFGTDERWRAIGALVHRPGNRTKPVVPEWEAFTAAALPPLLAAWRGEASPKQALAAAERVANAQLRAGTTP
ncbi:MAG TPA: extracellular solute-binding protein, partial [Chloroflexota bacterium]|nr:extracellular solute-binding protein [Chloroflexota bacterium]